MCIATTSNDSLNLLFYIKQNFMWWQFQSCLQSFEKLVSGSFASNLTRCYLIFSQMFTIQPICLTNHNVSVKKITPNISEKKKFTYPKLGEKYWNYGTIFSRLATPILTSVSKSHIYIKLMNEILDLNKCKFSW